MLECLRCHTLNDDRARFCQNCGDLIQFVPQSGARSVSYAGFWIRFVAALIDGLVLGVPMFFVGLFFGIVLIGASVSGDNQSAFGVLVLMRIAFFIIGVLYFCIMESSKTQGTLGKMAMGIKVTDIDGNRISFGRALGRYVSKFFSGIILSVGYMMAGWTKKKQSLHDLIASTVCIKKA